MRTLLAALAGSFLIALPAAAQEPTVSARDTVQSVLVRTKQWQEEDYPAFGSTAPTGLLGTSGSSLRSQAWMPPRYQYTLNPAFAAR